MKETIGYSVVAIGTILSVVAFIFFVGLGGSLAQLGIKSVVAPLENEVERKAFKRGPAHVEGTIEQLESYYMRYLQNDDNPAVQNALRGRFIRKYNELHPDDRDELSPDLREFAEQAKREQREQ